MKPGLRLRRTVCSGVAAALLLGSLGCGWSRQPPSPGALVASEAIELVPEGRPATLAANDGGWLLAWSHQGLELRESRDGGSSWATVAHLPEALTYAYHPEVGDHHFLVRREGEIHHLALTPGGEQSLSGPVFTGRPSVIAPVFRSRAELGVAALERSGGWMQLVFARSIDHGWSWDTARPVAASRSLGEPYSSYALLGARAGWLLAWADTRERETLFDIWTSSSRDGVTWSAAHKANDDAEPAWQIQPAVVETEGGALVAFMDWREKEPYWDRIQNVYGALLGGRNLEPRENVRVGSPSIANQGRPSLARQPGGDLVAAVWLDQRHRLTGDVYAAATRDGGRTWEGEICLSCYRTPAHQLEMLRSPLLTGTREGFLAAWEEAWGGERTVVLRPFRWASREEDVRPPPPAPERPPPPLTAREPSRLDGRQALVGAWSFDSPELAGWEPLLGSWRVRRGQLLGFGASPALLGWRGEPLEDFALEGRFRLDPYQHDAVYWFFRSETRDRQVVSGWAVSGHFRRGFLAQRIEGPFTASWDDPVYTLADHAFPLRQDIWYPFRLEVLGEEMAFWLGDERILSLSRLTTGAGTGSMLGTNPSPVAFDDLRLYRLEPSAPAVLRLATESSAAEE